jgi:hypothetical protein
MPTMAACTWGSGYGCMDELLLTESCHIPPHCSHYSLGKVCKLHRSRWHRQKPNARICRAHLGVTRGLVRGRCQDDVTPCRSHLQQHALTLRGRLVRAGRYSPNEARCKHLAVRLEGWHF